MIALWTRLGRPFRGRIALAFLLATAGGAMAALLLGVSGWFLTASAIAGAAGSAYAFNHLYPSATVRGTAMGRILARYGEQLVGHDATLRLSARLRRHLFEAEARARAGLARPASDSLAVFLDDVRLAEGALLRLWLPAASAAAASLIALVFAGLAGWVPLAVVAGGLALALATGRFGIAEQRRIDARLQTLNDRYRREAASLVENRVELEALGRFGDAAAALGSLSAETAGQALAAGRRTRLAGAFIAMLGGLSATLAVMLGSGATVSLLAGTALSVLAAHQSLAIALGALTAYPATELALSRLNTRIAAPPAIAEPADPAPAPGTILPVRTRQLQIGFPGAAPLCEVPDLDLAAGSVTEITGPSGCGKTTLLETLARLRPPPGGALDYAGIEAADLRAAAIRQHTGFAPQMPDTMRGTLADALRLAQPDADDARLLEACRTALFMPVVTRSPEGLYQSLEEGGSNLSGGELRRLAIARAILRGPELVLLDEPFAGLDAPMRETLAANLGAWARGHAAAIVLATHIPDAGLWPGLTYRQVPLTLSSKRHTSG